jgi:protein-S-isoprenylcysteine O-methyltransferase Ste14
MQEPKTRHEKWFKQRDDLTGEHAIGDAGQIVFALTYLSRYEERLLLKRFGDDYSSYMRDVGMWVPRLRRK